MNNTTGEENSKSINKLHFIYCVCIFGGAILLLIATILLDYKETVATLSNSGILLSIVLAIVAILITLWDVAGQKNALGDIREQINSIKEITDDIKTSAESSKELVAELQDFDSRFGVNFDPIKEVLDSIAEKIETPTESSGFESIKVSLEELRSMVSEKEDDLYRMRNSIESNGKTNNNEKKYIPKEFLTKRVSNYLRKLESGEEFARKELVVEVLKGIPFNTIKRAELNFILDVLIETGEIERKQKGKDLFIKI